MPKAPYRPMSRRYKGAMERFAPSELRQIDDAVRFPVPDEYAGLEWHSAEHDAHYGGYRRIGPSPKALLDLPVVVDRDLMLRVHVLQCIDAQDAARLRLSANGQPLETTVETTQAQTHLVSAKVELPARTEPTEGLRLAFEVAEVRQPFRLGINEDRRWLGVPVNWIELRPVRWIEEPAAQEGREGHAGWRADHQRLAGCAGSNGNPSGTSAARPAAMTASTKSTAARTRGLRRRSS